MSAWIFIIGLVLLWASVSSRLARRERRSSELAALDYPIKVATFWGRDAKAERQAHFDKFEEHKNLAQQYQVSVDQLDYLWNWRNALPP
jgi:hypothetical protein